MTLLTPLFGPMSVHLVLEDQWPIPVLMGGRLREAFGLQCERTYRDELNLAFFERLSACFANLLAECLDVDLQLPTSAPGTLSKHVDSSQHCA